MTHMLDYKLYVLYKTIIISLSSRKILKPFYIKAWVSLNNFLIASRILFKPTISTNLKKSELDG